MMLILQKGSAFRRCAQTINPNIHSTRQARFNEEHLPHKQRILEKAQMIIEQQKFHDPQL
tara:strand:- start:5658 stop:5837 length:180 start_codon:yes stop_codon:yes gene_type:complete